MAPITPYVSGIDPRALHDSASGQRLPTNQRGDPNLDGPLPTAHPSASAPLARGGVYAETVSGVEALRHLSGSPTRPGPVGLEPCLAIREGRIEVGSGRYDLQFVDQEPHHLLEREAARRDVEASGGLGSAAGRRCGDGIPPGPPDASATRTAHPRGPQTPARGRRRSPSSPSIPGHTSDRVRSGSAGPPRGRWGRLAGASEGGGRCSS